MTADLPPSARVLVAGLGVSGAAAAEALLARGHAVVAADDRPVTELGERSAALADSGARLVLGDGARDTGLLAGTDLVIASPGWPPHHAVLAAAAAAGVPVWSEPELAWRLRPAGSPPWVCVTGTNGKTTTVGLVASIAAAAGLRTATAGNIGTPLTDVVCSAEPLDLLAVELSSFQLHYVHTMAATSAAVLNLAPDHLDWHGSMAAYAADKGRIYERAVAVGVHNVADPVTTGLLRGADVADGCRAVGFTLGVPGPGEIGLVEDLLVDRALGPGAGHEARELAALGDLAGLAGPGQPPRHHVANALAAAALALGAGVSASAVRPGLAAATLPGHRGAVVATWRGVRFVDDSKATNPHAASAAIGSATGDVVWIAGGQAKGASFDELVSTHASRLRAAVLIGQDRDVVAAALVRHAPDVPRVVVTPAETGAVDPQSGRPSADVVEAYLDDVVRAAAALARPGDTVLLAPGGASLDQFPGYAARGDAFVRAVARATTGAA